MKSDWWAAYEKLLDGDDIEWAVDFDDWVALSSGVNLGVPLSMIPENREVQYTAPTPSVPLEELEDLDQMHNPCGAP